MNRAGAGKIFRVLKMEDRAVPPRREKIPFYEVINKWQANQGGAGAQGELAKNRDNAGDCKLNPVKLG